MKKLTLIGLCLSLPFSAFAEHDFAYYKAKTIEMLPVLNIDPKAVTFVSINTPPTIREYVTHPQAIFINSSFLNTKSEQDALFECAVQAQLSQARAIKGNMNNLLRGILVAGSVTYWFMKVFGKQIFTYNASNAQGQPSGLWTEDPRIQEKKKALGVLIGGLGITFLWWLRDQYTHPQISKGEFETGRLWVHLAVVNQLLTDEKTAPIAVQGMSLTAQQYELCATHIKHVSTEEQAELEKAYHNVSSRVQQWIVHHPNTTTMTV